MTVQSNANTRPSSVTTGPIAGSHKIYSSPEGRPDILVPFREIALDPSAKEEPYRAYDCSGVYTDPAVTIDLEAGLPPIRLAVNLSPAQLDKQDVCTLVSNALDDSGMDASMLDLELTESILMGNIEAGAVALRGLKQLGAMLSIDDFGTGYASFAYVKLLPVDRLKIDQSFVRGVMTDANDAAIVRATIQLAHSLNLRVMAEGVETAEQVSHLVSEGCNEMQGHFISMPLPAEEMKTFLQRRL